MLTLVEVRTAQGALLGLPLEDVTNGFVIEEINGLDPVKATIVSSSYALLDGSQYHSSKREQRNITLKVGLEPDYATTSVRTLRNQLYSFFMPKSEISLRFYDTDGLVVNIVGRVESCETPLFAREPQVDISVLCFDPDFMELSPVSISGMSTSTTDETLVTYDGTVDTGLTFVLNVDRTLTDLTFYHSPPDGTLRSMDISAALVAGDVVTISTVRGNKYATLTRSGTTTSILYGIAPQSNWHELQNGDNNVRIYATGASIPYSISYTNRYGGL